MSHPVSKYLTVLDRELHYVEWGDPAKPKLVMWHGLARTGRDFDDLAQPLSKDWNIVAPDTIGRGLSQWSPKPEVEYCYDFYAQLATASSMRWAGGRSTGSEPRWAARSRSAPAPVR